ncbi:MAG TPA: xanthine/uracil permease [Gallicola sp.]|nr:xanthine/uracil permease [Gallicola sp.]
MESALQIISFTTAIIFVIVNGCTQLFYAQSLGYKLKPTGFAYFIGAAGNLMTGNIVPISGQAETLTMSGMIKDFRSRIGSLLIASVFGIIIGLTGLVSKFVDFAGTSVIYGMMAGVGLILAEISFKLTKEEKRTGLISIIVALIVWALTKDVVYTIAASVAFATLDFCLLQKRRVEFEVDESTEWRFWKKSYWSDFELVKPKFNLAAIYGALGLICLNIGTNISFGNITAGMADVNLHVNALTIINSVADIPSIMFGGMPLEAIISGTAAAPWPLYAGIIMMIISGVLLLTGLMSKLSKFIPAQSIAGFLLVIGFAVTLVPNLILVSGSDAPIEGIIAASVTMITKNPFIGIVCGIIFKLLGSPLWIV